MCFLSTSLWLSLPYLSPFLLPPSFSFLTLLLLPSFLLSSPPPTFLPPSFLSSSYPLSSFLPLLLLPSFLLHSSASALSFFPIFSLFSLSGQQAVQGRKARGCSWEILKSHGAWPYECCLPCQPVHGSLEAGKVCVYQNCLLIIFRISFCSLCHT